LVDGGAFRQDPVFLVDVGASGGIDAYWSAFEDQLVGVGFDPLLTEVDHLNRTTPNPRVTYVPAWVTSHRARSSRVIEPSETPNTQFFQRTSAVRAAEIAELDYMQEFNNRGAEVRYAEHHVVLDEYFDAEARTSIDFIKVDTDGHDYDVLLGCDAILSSGRVLGLAVEAQFHGFVSADANLFSNVDLYLRTKGFGLFDLEINRYSRAALPARFVLSVPAQTTTGQVSWGEAIYFRDLADPDYEQTWNFHPSMEDVLKLACLFEIFGMPDCSAELVIKYGDEIVADYDRTAILDVLASEQEGRDIGYEDLLREFSDQARVGWTSS
jgi:FkbM family methyltransferase